MIHTNDRIIKHKTGLLNLTEELGNISRACKMFGVSRGTFYRYKEAVSSGGVEALQESAQGQVRVSNELRERCIFVSPSGIRSIWLRNDLLTSNCD